jgi:isoamyl acetate esterase
MSPSRRPPPPPPPPQQLMARGGPFWWKSARSVALAIAATAALLSAAALALSAGPRDSASLQASRDGSDAVPPPDGSYSWTRPTILALGDSITEFAVYEGGWWRAFAGNYSRRADVVNRGLAGYTTAWAVFAADEAVAAFGGSLAAALVWFGANDCKSPEALGGPKQSVPVDEYEDNLRTIVRKLRRAAAADAGTRKAAAAEAGTGPPARSWPVPSSAPIVVLVTPPPVHEQQWLERLAARAESEGKTPPAVSDRLNARVAEYAEAVRRVVVEDQEQEQAAASSSVLLADVHRAFVAAGADRGDDAARRFFADGLHLSPTGSDVALKVLQAALAETDASPERLPVHLPTFGQVDSDDPGSTFEPLAERGWGP